MRSKPRYVFDTNVVVSALLFGRSKPARAFFAALDEGELLVSADVVKELNDVLGRERFERYVSEEERTRFLRSLLCEASLIEPEEKIRACRDPKDDKYLELAVGGAADCIVTGDDDLLALNPFRGIPILTPEGFLSRMTRNAGAGNLKSSRVARCRAGDSVGYLSRLAWRELYAEAGLDR